MYYNFKIFAIAQKIFHVFEILTQTIGFIHSNQYIYNINQLIDHKFSTTYILKQYWFLINLSFKNRSNCFNITQKVFFTIKYSIIHVIINRNNNFLHFTPIHTTLIPRNSRDYIHVVTNSPHPSLLIEHVKQSTKHALPS